MVGLVSTGASIWGALMANQRRQNHNPRLLGQLTLFAAAAFVLLFLVWTYVR